MSLYKQTLYDRIQTSKKQKSLTGKGSQEDELQILRWMRQLTEGVIAIHELKITHRDLNPKNLFPDDDDQLIIGDFGIAIQKTWASTLIGTVGYAAPEVMKSPQYKQNADMYSDAFLLIC